MRVFTGPNGAGKTTIFKGILKKEEINLGDYVNADEIEKDLRENNSILSDDYHLKISKEMLQEFFKTSTFSPIKRNDYFLWQKVTVINNEFSCTTEVNAYLAADLAQFVRQQFLANGNGFN